VPKRKTASSGEEKHRYFSAIFQNAKNNSLQGEQ
jgi:hypothetical protein